MNSIEKNIYWKDIKPQDEVEITPAVFLWYGEHATPQAVVFWHGNEAAEAQRLLKVRAFARCKHADCNIRTAKLGDSCGHHPSDRPS